MSEKSRGKATFTVMDMSFVDGSSSCKNQGLAQKSDVREALGKESKVIALDDDMAITTKGLPGGAKKVLEGMGLIGAGILTGEISNKIQDRRSIAREQRASRAAGEGHRELLEGKGIETVPSAINLGEPTTRLRSTDDPDVIPQGFSSPSSSGRQGIQKKGVGSGTWTPPVPSGGAVAGTGSSAAPVTRPFLKGRGSNSFKCGEGVSAQRNIVTKQTDDFADRISDTRPSGGMLNRLQSLTQPPESTASAPAPPISPEPPMEKGFTEPSDSIETKGTSFRKQLDLFQSKVIRPAINQVSRYGRTEASLSKEADTYLDETKRIGKILRSKEPIEVHPIFSRLTQPERRGLIKDTMKSNARYIKEIRGEQKKLARDKIDLGMEKGFTEPSDSIETKGVEEVDGAEEKGFPQKLAKDAIKVILNRNGNAPALSKAKVYRKAKDWSLDPKEFEKQAQASGVKLMAEPKKKEALAKRLLKGRRPEGYDRPIGQKDASVFIETKGVINPLLRTLSGRMPTGAEKIVRNVGNKKATSQARAYGAGKVWDNDPRQLKNRMKDAGVKLMAEPKKEGAFAGARRMAPKDADINKQVFGRRRFGSATSPSVSPSRDTRKLAKYGALGAAGAGVGLGGYALTGSGDND